MKIFGGYTEESIKQHLTSYGSGIIFGTQYLDQPGNGGEKNGDTNFGINNFSGYPGRFEIDMRLLMQFENAVTNEDRQASLLALVATTLHESIHVANRGGFNKQFDLEIGPLSRKIRNGNMAVYYYNGSFLGNSASGEMGELFEASTWFNGNLHSQKNTFKQPQNGGLNWFIQLVNSQKKSENIPKPYDGA